MHEREKNKMLWDNLDRRISAAARLLEHVAVAGTGNTAKVLDYRSALILLCTVVEGMVYELVKKNTLPPKHIFHQSTRYVEKHTIPQNTINNIQSFFICEKYKDDISIDDNGADFGKFNLYLKNRNLVTSSEYKALNWARNERK